MASTGCKLPFGHFLVVHSTRDESPLSVDRGASPAKKDDYFEFFADIDLLCALSTCPGGDLSKFGWGTSDDEMKSTCRSLAVEVYELIDSSILADWKPPEPSSYRGIHGLKIPASGMD